MRISVYLTVALLKAGEEMSNTNVLLVGAGPMAIEYAKVLKSLGVLPIVIGRGEISAKKFTAETGLPVDTRGLEVWLADTNSPLPTQAIIAVGEKGIGTATKLLMMRGVRNLLVEKPGGFDAEDIRSVHATAIKQQATVYIGYNRRFYASVEAAKRVIANDGGVTSFNFEFTEWGHVISAVEKEEGVKEQWLLSNSTHVIDLAFHLGGFPREMSSFVQGSLDWHPAASSFSGAGKSEHGALFSYQANWAAPGRWGLEVLTSAHRLLFRPLEKLQIQKIGSVAIEMVDIDDRLDKEFKPGLYKQVQAFLAGDSTVLPTISEQINALDWYLRIRGDMK